MFGIIVPRIDGRGAPKQMEISRGRGSIAWIRFTYKPGISINIVATVNADTGPPVVTTAAPLNIGVVIARKTLSL